MRESKPTISFIYEIFTAAYILINVIFSYSCSVLRNKRTFSSSSSEVNLNENTSDRSSIADSRPIATHSDDSNGARLTPTNISEHPKPNEAQSNMQQKNNANTITSYFVRESQQLKNGYGISIIFIDNTYIL